MKTSDLIQELGTNFIEYAAAVNTDRAIPDARDGLKPVAKRILWSAFEEKRLNNKPHVKAARIVGDVMGKYHPHGDSSIYGAMVRLSQPWVMRYPLIDWHGSNGNIAGDGPAAARYTEARLTILSEQGLLNNIKKEAVDFIPNYDETLKEPVCLTSAFPNLLCNPNSGIGVAMACNWAPHNLKEVANAIYSYMDGETPTIPGPDFPTGGLIINGNEASDIVSKGRGSIKLRARYKIEGNKIIFYEVPYGETIEGLLGQIAVATEKKELEGIADAHDESNKRGIRIVIEAVRGVEPRELVESIYRKTSFQTSFAYNQVALVDKTPTELSLKDVCKIYVEHNQKCLIKELTFEKNKALARLEVVEGLLKALEDIDNIISLIKQSDNSKVAKEKLIEKYQFSENQAKAILSMRLSSLTKLDSIELNKEAKQLNKDIQYYNLVLEDENEQKSIIRHRLEGLVLVFGDERKTEITNIEVKAEPKKKKEIIPEDVVVVVNQGGDIKRIPKMNFKPQRKAGKGVKTIEEKILTSFATNTLDTAIIFTSTGKMYKLPVNKIPEGTNAAKGINLNNFFTFESGEKVQAVINLKETTNAEYVVFFTVNGMVKKTKIEEYKNIRKNIGTSAIKLKEGDAIANVTFLKDEEILIITRKGNILRADINSLPPVGRTTLGRKGINLDGDDEVVIGIPISKVQKDKFIVAGSKEGKIVKTNINEIVTTALNRKGIKLMKLAATDIIINGMVCDNNDKLLIIGTEHTKTINVSELTQTSRNSTGRDIVKTEKIKNLVKI